MQFVGGNTTASRLATSSKTWRSRKILGSYSGTPGFEPRYGYTDFGFHGFPKSLQANAGMTSGNPCEEGRVYVRDHETRFGGISVFEGAASAPLKAEIENPQPVCSFWKDVKEATVTRKQGMMQGFSQLRDITASLEMPCMAKETYQNSHNNLSAVIKEVSWQKMHAAGEEEAALSIQAGEVGDDGVLVIAAMEADIIVGFENFCVAEFCLATSAAVAPPTAGVLEEETYTNNTQAPIQKRSREGIKVRMEKTQEKTKIRDCDVVIPFGNVLSAELVFDLGISNAGFEVIKEDVVSGNIATCMAGNNAMFNFSYRNSGNNATADIEEELKIRVIRLQRVDFGLTRNHICSFAFQIYDEKGISHPFANNRAGKNWFYSFVRRNNDIVLRKAENVSYSRLMRFNKEILVLAGKGCKRVHAATHGEKGETITVVACTNATGTNWVPHTIKGRRPLEKLQFGNLFTEAWTQAATPKNEMSRFRATGIFPFKPKVIQIQLLLLSDCHASNYPKHPENIDHSLAVKATLVTRQLFSKGIQGNADQPSSAPVHKRRVKIRENNDDMHCGDCGRKYHDKSMDVPGIQCVEYKVCTCDAMKLYLFYYATEEDAVHFIEEVICRYLRHALHAVQTLQLSSRAVGTPFRWAKSNYMQQAIVDKRLQVLKNVFELFIAWADRRKENTYQTRAVEYFQNVTYITNGFIKVLYLEIYESDSYKYTHGYRRCDENTARQFIALLLKAMAHLMRVAVSTLSLPHFYVSNAEKALGEGVRMRVAGRQEGRRATYLRSACLQCCGQFATSHGCPPPRTPDVVVVSAAARRPRGCSPPFAALPAHARLVPGVRRLRYSTEYAKPPPDPFQRRRLAPSLRPQLTRKTASC
ncbi:hypothetical protein PR048_013492 [Dryococelus australis]|uniref:HTH CENPB-type domain-containing protein n=1 Tax=Dryococelus australis TaxID=614101 RepID=A0ABQ9HSC6_9NEOP|nr:hypothetical protein PR048_013492 [Dryococelus australis]